MLSDKGFWHLLRQHTPHNAKVAQIGPYSYSIAVRVFGSNGGKDE